MNGVDPSTRPRTTRPRRGSYRPVTIGFLAWLLCSGAWSGWENHRSRPARLVGRFEYYLARWKPGLGVASGKPVAALIAELGSEQPVRRWQAAKRLGDCAAEVATPALIAALGDEQGTQRTCQIAHNLGRIGDRRAVPALIRAIDHPSNRDLRVCAAMALGDIGDQRALEPLISAYRERSSWMALHSVAYLGDPRAAPFLESVARSTRDGMHKHTAEHGLLLLDLLGSADPAGALVAALPSLPRRSQIWAIGHLVRMNDGRTIEPLCRLASDGQRVEEVRICAAAALATFGTRAAAQIRNLAGADDAFARVLGGLAAHHVDDSIPLATIANAGETEKDGFVRACLAIVNDVEVNPIERRR